MASPRQTEVSRRSHLKSLTTSCNRSRDALTESPMPLLGLLPAEMLLLCTVLPLEHPRLLDETTWCKHDRAVDKLRSKRCSGNNCVS